MLRTVLYMIWPVDGDIVNNVSGIGKLAVVLVHKSHRIVSKAKETHNSMKAIMVITLYEPIMRFEPAFSFYSVEFRESFGFHEKLYKRSIAISQVYSKSCLCWWIIFCKQYQNWKKLKG